MATREPLRTTHTNTNIVHTLLSNGTIRTIPRKRRPRAVGEVSISSVGSQIYVNSEFNENNEIVEPVYQNITKETAKSSILAPAIVGNISYLVAKNIETDSSKESMAVTTFIDESDHYYETMSPLGNKRHSTQLVNSHLKLNVELPKSRLDAVSKQQSVSAHVLGQHTEDYDSFDTDTEDIFEAEDTSRPHDSGVDLNHSRLPDPPTSTNQVYAIVRKFKNFISSKKTPGSTLKMGSSQKLYVNSSFYVERQVIANETTATPKIYSSSKINNSTIKSVNSLTGIEGPPTAAKSLMAQSNPASTSLANSPQTDNYENTEFHAPSPITSESKQLSSSDRIYSTQLSAGDLESSTLRAKTTSSKSFKSRLRKSLGSSFETKRSSPSALSQQMRNSTFYIASTNSNGGELDSGFSEKTSSGDLTSPYTPPSNHGHNEPSQDSQSSRSGTETPKFLTIARKTKKDNKISTAQRRRTTVGVRPIEPPPPPPADVKHQSSWYAECGVFKSSGSDLSALNSARSTHSQNGSISINPMSWYAEAGLYQTSGVSVASASSSGSSGVSTGNEGGMGDDLSHSLFQNEPLYQIYSATKLQYISNDMEDDSTDGYEEIGHHKHANSQLDEEVGHKKLRPTALQLVEPKNGPSRTLWSEIPEVVNSCILPTLNARERCLQEAKFEIITSEASYLKSLNLLRTHFMNYQPFRDVKVMSARDRKTLFAHIIPVHECSERLLTELESCWQDNIMLQGLSKRIYSIAEKHFHVYIAFCEHQGRMDRTLRRLKDAKSSFARSLETLEASPSCCGLNLHSFLMLPMQRITRLPLLIDAVFSKVDPSDDEYDSWKMTLAILNKIVSQCNDAANRCEQAYEIERISRQLEFPSTIRSLAIAPVGVSAPGAIPRFLVKKGELTQLVWRGDDAKLTFGKKFTKTNIYAFLFSDLLVLTKRKGEEHFVVFDYCPRNLLTLSPGDQLPQLPTKDLHQTGKNLILMTLLENHERKTIELVVSCPSVSEQERWLHAMRPPEAETPGEKLYEQWDCPQVVAKHAYDLKEPDALGLEIGDVINVMRKLPDGWFHGERIRDGASGWFPGSFTEEVNSAHVRARNLKQRYRLLTFTATYLEAQKRK